MSRTCLDENLVSAIAKCCQEFLVPWVGTALPSSGGGDWRIQAIGSNESIDASKLSTAMAIQLQMFGSLEQDTVPARYAAWTPTLPVELASYEHLAAKVQAVRGCLLEGKPIGAALIANTRTIYEDVRYLLDAGFDWLEIIQAPHYSLRPDAYLEFAEVSEVVAKAIKARQDSRVIRCPLWLTAATSSPAELVKYLEQGIDGVCIDGYLASRAPVQPAVRDMLAGIRVQSFGSGQADYGWLANAFRDIQSFIEDVVRFRE